MLTTLLSKNDTKTNMREALERYDQHISEENLEDIIEELYTKADLGHWTLSDYLDFAADVCNEWGNYRYVMSSYYDIEEYPSQITINITDLDERFDDIQDAIVDWFTNKSNYDDYVSSFDYVVEEDGDIRIFNIEWE